MTADNVQEACYFNNTLSSQAFISKNLTTSVMLEYELSLFMDAWYCSALCIENSSDNKNSCSHNQCEKISTEYGKLYEQNTLTGHDSMVQATCSVHELAPNNFSSEQWGISCAYKPPSQRPFHVLIIAGKLQRKAKYLYWWLWADSPTDWQKSINSTVYTVANRILAQM
jgi:hypothetical protein